VAKNLILASPDVDRIKLITSPPALNRLVDRITVYVSRDDKVLKLATQIAGSPRAGDASEGLVVFPSADTVDATSRSSYLLGYGVDSILHDIFAILKHGLPPDKRVGLKQAGDGDKKYWVYN
jgi:alpha/beta hydrolase family protein DUF900